VVSVAPKILVLEDEENVGATLVERLQREGYQVDWAKSARQAEGYVMAGQYNLALVDVGLPDGDGFDVVENLNKKQENCAVIFLTAFGTAEQRILGLELGAEDYVVKPFHIKELLLRIRNALKRFSYSSSVPTEVESQKILLGKAVISLSKFEVESDGDVHSLTYTECTLLKFLIERRGKVVSRDEILNFVWAKEDDPTPRTIDNFILRLRRLIEEDPEHPQLIVTVRGVGYQLSDRN